MNTIKITIISKNNKKNIVWNELLINSIKKIKKIPITIFYKFRNPKKFNKNIDFVNQRIKRNNHIFYNFCTNYFYILIF